MVKLEKRLKEAEEVCIPRLEFVMEKPKNTQYISGIKEIKRGKERKRWKEARGKKRR